MGGAGVGVRVYRTETHGRYDVRDRLGHFVKPRSAELTACPHACCQGRRPHPEKLPVKFDKQHLRSLSEPELIREMEQYSNFTRERKDAYLQIIAEIDRRDRAEKAAARRKHRRESANQEYRDEVYRQTLLAEAATNGYMLNREGKARDIDPVSLFTGPEARVRKYASPELIEWFEKHPRPTRASWFGSARSRREHLSGRRIG